MRMWKSTKDEVARDPMAIEVVHPILSAHRALFSISDFNCHGSGPVRRPKFRAQCHEKPDLHLLDGTRVTEQVADVEIGRSP